MRRRGAKATPRCPRVSRASVTALNQAEKTRKTRKESISNFITRSLQCQTLPRTSARERARARRGRTEWNFKAFLKIDSFSTGGGTVTDSCGIQFTKQKTKKQVFECLLDKTIFKCIRQINIHRSEVHCGSAFEPGASGLPYYCTSTCARSGCTRRASCVDSKPIYICVYICFIEFVVWKLFLTLCRQIVFKNHININKQSSICSY